MAYQRALAMNGTLVLRNEDLDPQRSKPHFVEAMIEDLHWLGISWQEGPDVGGAFAPYAQSERYALYRKAWERLRAGGWIYPCRCSRRELASRALEAPTSQTRDAGHPHSGGWNNFPEHEDDDEPLYPGTCRPALGTIAEADTPAGVNWRFRVPDGKAVTFVDGHFGPQSFLAGKDFGDFLIWRRDDVAAYQLAVVVDDAAMEITEVVRGADLLKSTARQMLLNRALGYRDPSWFHCELLRDERGQRLAKRHDSLSLRALRASGLSAVEVLRSGGG